MRRILFVGTALAAAALAAGGYYWLASAARPPIAVGILHSLTGPMAGRERSMIDAEVMALEEINAAGGLLGRRLTWTQYDGRSDELAYAEGARRLIDESKVAVLFGCDASPCRKRVKPVVEERNHLLFYPKSFEGAEESPNIIYAGGPGNQQVVPTVAFCVDELHATSFALIGSDSIGPRVSLALAADQVKGLGGRLVSEQYLLPNATDLGAAVDAIKRAAPGVILSCLEGDSNAPFYEGLARAGLTPEAAPVMSFTVGEEELRSLPPKDVAGHYAAWNYMQSIDRPENADFIRRYRARFGAERPTHDAMISAYNCVKLWAQAVAESGGPTPRDVLRSIGRQSLDGPEGVVSIDPDTLQAWRPVQVGKIRPDRQFDIVFVRPKPVQPIPFPKSRPQASWVSFVADLSAGWNGGWSNPARPGASPR